MERLKTFYEVLGMKNPSINEGIIKTAIGAFQKTGNLWSKYLKEPKLIKELKEKDDDISKGYFWAKSKEGLSIKKVVKAIAEYAEVYYQQLNSELLSEAGKDVSKVLNLENRRGTNKTVLDSNINVVNFRNKQYAVKNATYKKLAINEINKLENDRAKEWANSMLISAELAAIDAVLNDQKVKATTNVDTINQQWDTFKNLRNQTIDKLAADAEKEIASKAGTEKGDSERQTATPQESTTKASIKRIEELLNSFAAKMDDKKEEGSKDALLDIQKKLEELGNTENPETLDTISKLKQSLAELLNKEGK